MTNSLLSDSHINIMIKQYNTLCGSSNWRLHGTLIGVDVYRSLVSCTLGFRGLICKRNFKKLGKRIVNSIQLVLQSIIIIISAVHATAGRWPPQLTPCTSILSHPYPLTATDFLDVVCLSISFWVSLLLAFLLWVSIMMLS